MQSNFRAGSKKFGPAQNVLGPVKGQGKNRLVLGLVKRSTVVRSYTEATKGT